jgi:hypothetical protein
MFNRLMVWLGYQKIPSVDITEVEQLTSDQKKLELVDDDFSIDHLITPPSKACYELMERILPRDRPSTNIGVNVQKEDDFDTKDPMYKNFIEFIYNNSDGIKIPITKTINDYFENALSRREIKKFKSQMEISGMLIPTPPHTYVLNLSFDWDKYFMI